MVDKNINNNFVKTTLKDLIEIRSNIFSDKRGEFINAFRLESSNFRNSWGLRNIKQVNISKTVESGVIRGLHFQKDPNSEAKLVRCIKGIVWDVAVDLRKESKTYCKWFGLNLSPELGNSLFIPEGFAHGFQTLTKNCELLYIHSGNWVKESESGVRFDDPQLSINWPMKPTFLSERDMSLPFLAD